MKLDRLLPLLMDVPPGRLRVLLALQSVCIRASAQLVANSRKERDPVKTHLLPETGERTDVSEAPGSGLGTDRVWCSPWQGAAGASASAAPSWGRDEPP
jgi:hypothetical protein